MSYSKAYIVHRHIGGGGIKDGDKLKVTLLDGFKLEYINEFNSFNVKVIEHGVEDLTKYNGRLVERETLFVEVSSKM